MKIEPYGQIMNSKYQIVGLLIKYENKGNETEYNPSWANSS